MAFLFPREGLHSRAFGVGGIWEASPARGGDARTIPHKAVLNVSKVLRGGSIWESTKLVLLNQTRD